MAVAGSILMPALLAGTVAIGVTLAIERLGGRVGGLIATLPSTIVPAAWGLYAVDPERFASTMAMAPLGMWLNAVFLWLWGIGPRRLSGSLPIVLTQMVVLSLSAWTVGAMVVVWVTDRALDAGIAPLAIGACATLGILATGVAATWSEVPTPKGKQPVGWTALAMRGLLAGSAVAVAILVARSGHPLLAGMASVFPAIFLTSMVSVWLAQGQAVSAGAVGPMMLGSASVAAYAVASPVVFPSFGPLMGTLLSWGLAVGLVTLPAAAWLRRRAHVHRVFR